jgi:hypothetical protein
VHEVVTGFFTLAEVDALMLGALQLRANYGSNISKQQITYTY